MDVERKGHTPAIDVSGAQPGKAKAARGKGKNRAAEREHYARQIEANEERLRTGLTVDGTPMTAHQMETTRQVIEQQREKLNSMT
jgi:hypothetical protein